MSDAPAPTPLTRVRITYGKIGPQRYTGNLDMHTVWERTLRRAGLPLAYTQGFNPHPRFHLASTLPLGASSRCELMDVWLVNPPDLAIMRAQIEAAAPPGLEVYALETVSLQQPALQTQIQASEFCVTLLDWPADQDLAGRITALLEAISLPREWRGKTYDLRPLVEEIRRVKQKEGEPPQLLMRLAAREGATGRPEEVLSVMGIDPFSTRVERTAIVIQ